MNSHNVLTIMKGPHNDGVNYETQNVLCTHTQRLGLSKECCHSRVHAHMTQHDVAILIRVVILWGQGWHTYPPFWQWFPSCAVMQLPLQCVPTHLHNQQTDWLTGRQTGWQKCTHTRRQTAWQTRTRTNIAQPISMPLRCLLLLLLSSLTTAEYSTLNCQAHLFGLLREVKKVCWLKFALALLTSACSLIV